MEAMTELKSQGKIRSYGVSNFGVTQMEEALATGAEIDTNQITYNIFSRAIEHAILPFCVQHNISVIGTMTLQQGLLTGAFTSAEQLPPNQRESRHFHIYGNEGAEKEIFEALVRLKEVAAEAGCSLPQLAVAWALCRRGIAASLIGSRSTAELEENLRAAEVTLSKDVIAQIDEISRPVLDRLGGSPDFYRSGENSRIF